MRKEKATICRKDLREGGHIPRYRDRNDEFSPLFTLVLACEKDQIGIQGPSNDAGVLAWAVGLCGSARCHRCSGIAGVFGPQSLP